jgi:hypothetical protein
MICERCGKEFSDSAAICPACGTVMPNMMKDQVITNYGQSPSSVYDSAQSVKNNGALAAEILFSLIGVYGVGWLIAGEIAIGVILLVCSFAVFAPLAIMIAIYTFGVGIFVFDLPLAIGGIILNAILLNRVLNRKASQAHKPML